MPVPSKTPRVVTNPYVLTAPDIFRVIFKGKDINIIKAAEGFTPELQVCNLIGTATGTDLFMCIYMAGRHAKNFFDRVFCYTIKETDDDPNMVEVSFYEWKKS